MCGGRSLHKKDWLQLGLGLGAAGVGLGAAGVGPLSGLLSGAAGAAAPGEAAGAFVGTAAELPGLGTGALKGLEAYQKANALMQLAQGPGQQTQQVGVAPRPQAATNDPALADLYSLIYPQRKRKDY